MVRAWYRYSRLGAARSKGQPDQGLGKKQGEGVGPLGFTDGRSSDRMREVIQRGFGRVLCVLTDGRSGLLNERK